MVGGRCTDASANPKHPRHAGGKVGSTAGGSSADVGGGGGVGHAGDRLSALPDDFLHAIMSRLKALQLVRTCVLSTRWRHLWRAVPCLDVDEEETGAYNNFDNFTTNLLRSHDIALLEDFRLHASTSSDLWVRRAVGQDEAWPCRLKRLHLFSLRNLKLTDIGSHISSRCPVLEDVQLKSCSFLLTSNTKIVSSSLKKLAVVDGYYMVHEDEIFALIIEAPTLVSLRLDGELYHIVDTTEPHTLPSLVDASIHLPWPENRANHHQLGILGALSNVTTLCLSQFAVMLLFHVTREDLPVFTFENMRSLLLDECHISDDFLGLQQYLHNARNLKKLTLRHCKAVQQVLDYRHNKEMRERLHKSSEHLMDFKCENLRLSEIIYKDGDTSVHLLMFLLNATRMAQAVFILPCWFQLTLLDEAIQDTPTSNILDGQAGFDFTNSVLGLNWKYVVSPHLDDFRLAPRGICHRLLSSVSASVLAYCDPNGAMAVLEPSKVFVATLDEHQRTRLIYIPCKQNDVIASVEYYISGVGLYTKSFIWLLIAPPVNWKWKHARKLVFQSH